MACSRTRLQVITMKVRHRCTAQESDLLTRRTCFFLLDIMSSVGAARKVSSNWSHEIMTCHSSNCFSIV